MRLFSLGSAAVLLDIFFKLLSSVEMQIVYGSASFAELLCLVVLTQSCLFAKVCRKQQQQQGSNWLFLRSRDCCGVA